MENEKWFDLKKRVEASPLTFLGVVAAAGLVTGLLIARRQTPARLVKRIRKDWIATARDTRAAAQPALEELRSVGEMGLAKFADRFREEIGIAKQLAGRMAAEKLRDISARFSNPWSSEINSLLEGVVTKLKEGAPGSRKGAPKLLLRK